MALRIRLSCRPVILNRVLHDILSRNPDFELVGPTSDPVDAMISTGDDPATMFDYLDIDAARAKVLIIIDRHRNTLYLRRPVSENMGIEMLPGEMPELLGVLNREVARQSYPSTKRLIA